VQRRGLHGPGPGFRASTLGPDLGLVQQIMLGSKPGLGFVQMIAIESKVEYFGL
jgi:hypothetical protein